MAKSSAKPPEIKTKRVYLPPDDSDGRRILVDRLWPRGLTKEKAAVDVWLKDVAPSTELRQWFHHEEPRWDEFQRRYEAELRQNPAVGELRKLLAEGPATLLYGAKSETENQAVVLIAFLRSKQSA